MVVYVSQSVQSPSRVRLFVTPWIAALQASLSNSWSLLKPMSIESVMPSNHLILCLPLLLTSVLPSIRVFTNASVSLHQVAKVSGSQMWQFPGSRETTQICFVLSVCIWLTNLVLWNVLPGSFCFIIPTSDSSVSWSFPWWPFSYFFSWFIPRSDPLYMESWTLPTDRTL